MRTDLPTSHEPTEDYQCPHCGPLAEDGIVFLGHTTFLYCDRCRQAFAWAEYGKPLYDFAPLCDAQKIDHLKQYTMDADTQRSFDMDCAFVMDGTGDAELYAAWKHATERSKSEAN